ncbi:MULTISPECIES: hypothetical protein [unclassified Haloferax]|uniref:hypothetical protein n=1 Tax=unclassified Haloferax TaxID=2625095 RepID=UPI0011C04506|nr:MULTISPECIES: hypothetical protein [unclassified Haloferax]
MGVVRREGSWRLEKKQDGVYEVTDNKRLKMKVVTSDYVPSDFSDERNDFSVPVREVESFSEAEALFETVASTESGSSSSSFAQPDADSSVWSSSSGGTPDWEPQRLPPAGIAFVGFLSGSIVVNQSGFQPRSTTFIVGVGLLLVGVVVTAAAILKYREGGLDAALEFLRSSES